MEVNSMASNESKDHKDLERFSVSIPADLNQQFEDLRNKLNLNRSDAIRRAMHLFLKNDAKTIPEGIVIGSITYLEASHLHGHPVEHKDQPHEHEGYIHTHDEGEKYYSPVEKVEVVQAVELEHEFLDIIISTMHVHLSPDSCMQVIAVKGPHNRIRELYTALHNFKTIKDVQMAVVQIESR